MRANGKVLATIAALASFGLVAAGCGSSGSSAGSGSGGSAAASASGSAGSASAGSASAGSASSGSAAASASGSASSGASGSSSSSSASSGSTSGSAQDLTAICPNPVKIQINWTPEVEQAAYYELAASDGTIDSDQKTYTAPLLDPFTGKKRDLKVQVIAGGPSVGYNVPEQLLYQNPDILLGMDALDLQIQSFAKTPTIGVVSPMTHYANIKFWSPDAFQMDSLSDMGKTGATILTQSKTGPLTLYLQSKGWIKSDQIDGSYKGSPARFVASNGHVISQGYATYEPYYYAHVLKQWKKPIAYMLLYPTGYDPYSESTFVTPDNLKKYSDCLKQLVPMIQKAQLNYLQSPDRTNEMIVNLVEKYNIAGGFYNMDIAKYAHETMLKDKIMEQPKTGAFGSYDMDRVDNFIDIMTSTKTVTNLPDGFSSKDLATNEFIDPDLKMDFYDGPYNDVKGTIIEK